MKSHNEKSLFSVSGTDETYKRFQNDISSLSKHKSYLEKMFRWYYPQFADSDFCDSIAYSFHPSFWEMYLAYILMKHGHDIIPRKEQGKPCNGRPDICLKMNFGKVWIEAHAPDAGAEIIKNEAEEKTTNPNRVPSPRDDSDEFDEIPNREIILRYRHSLSTKLHKYEDYVNKSIVEKNQPFIIAVNGGNLPFFESDLYLNNNEIPLIVQAILGVSNYTAFYDTILNNTVSEGVLYKRNVPKLMPDGSLKSIPTDIFESEEYSGISGVLFSAANVFHAYDRRGREFIYIHNHNANQKLPKGWLKFGREYWKKENMLFWKDASHKRIYYVRIHSSSTD